MRFSTASTLLKIVEYTITILRLRIDCKLSDARTDFPSTKKMDRSILYFDWQEIPIAMLGVS
jgi:hypothetical protein